MDVAPEVAQICEIWAWRDSWRIRYERRYLIVCDYSIHTGDRTRKGAILSFVRYELLIALKTRHGHELRGQKIVLSFNGYWGKRSEYSLAKPGEST